MSKTIVNTPKAVEDCHKLLLWLIPKLNQFPRVHRFTLGDRIEIKCLELLECLVETAFSKQKKLSLYQANLNLEVLRHLWRMAFELKIIAMKTYHLGSKMINDLGRQIGGWYKSVLSKS